MLIMSPDFYTRTRDAGTPVALITEKFSGIILSSNLSRSRNTQALLFMYEDSSIEIGFHLIGINYFQFFTWVSGVCTDGLMEASLSK